MAQSSESFVAIWFMFSLGAYILEHVINAYSLERKGVKMSFFLSGTPWYVSRKYREWCQQNGKSPHTRLAIKRVLLANAVIATLALLVLTAGWLDDFADSL